MEFGSKFVYVGGEDEEEIYLSEPSEEDSGDEGGMLYNAIPDDLFQQNVLPMPQQLMDNVVDIQQLAPSFPPQLQQYIQQQQQQQPMPVMMQQSAPQLPQSDSAQPPPPPPQQQQLQQNIQIPVQQQQVSAPSVPFPAQQQQQRVFQTNRSPRYQQRQRVPFKLNKTQAECLKRKKITRNRPDDGESCMLDILDTAGQEEYSVLRDQYMHSGDGFLIIFSVTDAESFQEAEALYNWSKKIQEKDSVPARLKRVAGKERIFGLIFKVNTGYEVRPIVDTTTQVTLTQLDSKNVQVLCGNKQDLEADRCISEQDGKALGAKLNIPYFETSAKTAFNVNEVFETLVRNIPRTGIHYKIVILGSGGVGKSSLCIQYCQNTFVDEYDPTIEDTYRKLITLSGLKPAEKKDEKEAGATAGPSEAKVDKKKGKKVKRAKTDTNVILISMRVLQDEPKIVTGDPTQCKQCSAVLSSISTITQGDSGKMWVCEFCGTTNVNIDTDPGEIPDGESFDFLLRPAANLSEAQKSKEKGLVIYCLDISGSMDVKAEIPRLQAEWRAARDGDNQQEWRTRITRLDCIKEAAKRQLEHQKLDDPEKKVLIVLFESSVRFLGDCTCAPIKIKENLNSYGSLLEKGKSLTQGVPPKSIRDSFDAACATIESLKTEGCTAIGPALAISCGYLSSFPASEVTLFTDGAPNTGVGGSGDQQFYKTIGDYAKSKDCVINIIAVEGESVQLSRVSKAAEHSNGMVNILHPLELTRQLRLIGQNPTIATGVDVRFILHPAFAFVDSDHPEMPSMMVKEIGNVTRNTDLTYRYKPRDPTQKFEITTVPFQIQITYSLKDGSKYMKVLSKKIDVTDNRSISEEGINISVVATDAAKTCSVIAQKGDNEAARAYIYSVDDMMLRGAKSVTQREDHFAFQNEMQELVSEVKVGKEEWNRKRTSDKTTAMFAQNMMQQQSSDVYRGSSNAVKQMSVAQRKAAEPLRKQYYGYKFK